MPHPAIGLSAWSFHRHLFAGVMDLPTFFAVSRALGVNQVELNNPFIASNDAASMQALAESAASVGVEVVNLAIDDFEVDLSSPNEGVRSEAVRRHTAWLDAAMTLGSPVLRANSGGLDAGACVQSFTELARAASERGIRVVIEAHGGFSSDAALILPILDRVREAVPGGVGLIPDFGNVHVTAQHDRYEQIAAMAPYADLCHPKMHDFDEHGRQREWDTQRLVSEVAATGFRGPWVIEFEGQADEFDGARQSVAHLSDCLRLVA